MTENAEAAEPFEIDGGEHERGNAECASCWQGYPARCQCGGLVHASFGDESYDGYWLYKVCDKCEDPDVIGDA